MCVWRNGRPWSSIAVMALVAMMFSSIVILEPVTADSAQAAPAAPIARDPGGRWGPVEDWPMMAIHAALDSNGRVVTYGTNPDGRQTGRFIYDIWTPSPSAASGHNTLDNTTRTDIFCSLQLNRPDTGDMVLFGGDNWTGTTTNNLGNADITQIDASSGAIAPLPGMNRARWYATGTTMPNGSFYVQGGKGGADRPERWSPQRGSELLSINTSAIGWFYPRNFVAPDGRIFGFSSEGTMYYVSEALNRLDVVGRLPAGHRGDTSAAVMFEPGRILLFGGPSPEALVIDITGGGAPVITSAGTMSSIRRWANGTILPDGRVLATGGAVKNSVGNVPEPIETYGTNFTAEIWDPRTGRWTVGDEAQVPRLYHSTALLLPDGRVLTAGGGSPGPVTNTDAELYHPDYLTTASGSPMPRPQITALSNDTLTAGQRLAITVPSGTDVARVTLVKTGSVTHSFNMEQRFVELDFRLNRAAGGDIVVTHLPDNDATITPGYYLVSVLDGNGIPSPSKLVKIGVPDPTRPTSTLDGQIVRLYRAAFQRMPDSSSFVYWRRQMLHGMSSDTMAALFAASPEFNARYGRLGNGGFVDQLYTSVLGRGATTPERNFWIGQLDAGLSRADALLAFADSAEFQRRTGTAGLRPTGIASTGNPTPPPAPAPGPGSSDPAAASYEGEIRRLYLGYFGREPDRSGLTYWAAVRAGGVPLVSVANEFAASAEVRSRYGQTTYGQYVDLVYNNVLGRAADRAGRQYWIGRLATGVTRGELMVAFTESPENVAAVG